MKKTIYVLAFLAAFTFSACSNAQSNEGETTEQDGVINKDVDVKEFAQLVEAGNGLLLDVRTDGEFASGHLKGSSQIDYNKSNFKEKVAELDKEVPVYIYCRSGNRSGRAAKMMKGMGFKAVYNLEGGILAWGRAGKPIEK